MTFFFSLFPFPRRIVVTRPKCLSAREREQDVRLSDVSAGQGLTPCCNCVRKLETVFVQPLFQRGEREVKVGKTHSAFRSGSLRLRSEILANHGHAGRAECPSPLPQRHQAPLNLVRPSIPFPSTQREIFALIASNREMQVASSSSFPCEFQIASHRERSNERETPHEGGRALRGDPNPFAPLSLSLSLPSYRVDG